MQRNVRPRLAAYDEDDHVAEDHRSDEESEDGESIGSEVEQQNGMSEDEPDQDDEDGGDFEQQISNVSFGALKQAQDAISRKRKRGSDANEDQEEKLEAVRARLREIKAAKSAPTGKISKSSQSTIKQSKETEHEEREDETDDSDEAPSEEDAPTKSRTSKHAPAAQSSRYQVSRKRVVVDVPKRVVRDPRFDALHQHSAHPGDSEKAYSFLRDYQKSEINELKAAIKKTKNEDEKETLRRKMGSMENRLKAKEAKEREQDIIRRHRKEEREKIESGKNPYYLKKKDIKEKALVEKFKGMKSKEREKVIEKRRKKEGQKEKKRMPNMRRVAG